MLYRNFSTQYEIDHEYNAVTMVDDLQQYINHDHTKNIETRNEVKSILDEQYGPMLDETLDFFPATEPDAPILVFIHGGYWHSMSNKDFSLVAQGLVLNGITVAIPNYSLCPKVTISEITRQNSIAIAWLYKHAKRFNGDPERIFICGHSAGGQQVGIITATNWEGEYGLPNNLIKGSIPISGIYDLTPLYYSWLQPKLQLNHDLINKQSPLFQISENKTPMLISYGENESAEFKRQSEYYFNALIKRGYKAQLHEQKEKNHFMTFRDLNDPDSSFCQLVIEFIKQHVK